MRPESKILLDVALILSFMSSPTGPAPCVAYAPASLRPTRRHYPSGPRRKAGRTCGGMFNSCVGLDVAALAAAAVVREGLR